MRTLILSIAFLLTSTLWAQMTKVPAKVISVVPVTVTTMPIVVDMDPDMEQFARGIDGACQASHSDFSIPTNARVLFVNKGLGHNVYKSIQAAYNAARDGDYIFIGNGTYREKVRPAAGATHRRVTFVGESQAGVQLVAPQAHQGTAFYIGNGAKVQNLTIRNYQQAISIVSRKGASITALIMRNNINGVNIRSYNKVQGLSDERIELACNTIINLSNGGQGIYYGDKRYYDNEFNHEASALVNMMLNKIMGYSNPAWINKGKVQFIHNLVSGREGSMFGLYGNDINNTGRVWVTRSGFFNINAYGVVMDDITDLKVDTSIFKNVSLAIDVKQDRYPIKGDQYLRNGEIRIFSNKIFEGSRGITVGFANLMHIQNNLIYQMSEMGMRVSAKKMVITNNTLDKIEGDAIIISAQEINSHLNSTYIPKEYDGKVIVLNNIITDSHTAFNMNSVNNFFRRKMKHDVTAFLFYGNNRNLAGNWDYIGYREIDPLFQTNSYRLASNSPAVDSGKLYLPYDQEDVGFKRRIRNYRIDLGAYELQQGEWNWPEINYSL